MPEQATPEKPRALRIAYYIAVVAAVGLILAGLVLFSAKNLDPQLPESVARNFRFMAVANIIGGLLVAALAGQFNTAGKIGRRVYLGVVVFYVVINLIAVMFKVGGVGLMIVALLLVASAMCYFQPSVSSYIAESGQKR